MARHMKVVVIGYGTAGLTAAGFAHKFSREAEVIALEERHYAVYHPCSIPDVISGKVKAWSDIVEDVYKSPRFKVLTSMKVTGIDASNQRVYGINLASNSRFSIEYDKLILATGSRPLRLEGIPGSELAGIFCVKNVEDGMELHRKALNSRKVVVIGAGPLGIEVSVALKTMGLKVSLIELMPTILPGKVDRDLAIAIMNHMSSKGIEVLTNNKVVEFRGKGNYVEKVLTEESEIDTDFVVLCVGVRPNVDLAIKMGLKLGPLGGIKVDRKMRTSIENIFAAGDCAEVWDAITGKPAMSFLANACYQQGRVAGINAVGGDETYRGTLFSWAVSTEYFNLGGVGLTSERARHEGFNAFSLKLKAHYKPHFYPDSKEIVVKVIVDASTLRILGAQIMGEINISYILNFFALAILRGLSVYDLVKMEQVYVPNLIGLPDPVFKVLEAIIRRARAQIR